MDNTIEISKVVSELNQIIKNTSLDSFEKENSNHTFLLQIVMDLLMNTKTYYLKSHICLFQFRII